MWEKPTKYLCAFVFSIILSGCATTDQKDEKLGPFSPQGYSATLYYSEAGKSYKLKSDIYLLAQKAVRIDLRTQLDLPLASILMTDQKLEYVLYRDKKYFSGKPGPGALDSIIPLDITAEDLVAIVQERPMKNQKCFQAGGKIARCQGNAGPMSYNVSWDKRDSTRPWLGRATKINVDLSSRGINLKFYLTDWQKNLSNLSKLTELQVPENFQK